MNSKLFKVGVLALLGFSSYNLAVIAGNTTKTAVAHVAQADYLIQSLEKLSPILSVVLHKEFKERATHVKDVAYRDDSGWHYQGKDYTAEEMNKLLEKHPMQVIYKDTIGKRYLSNASK